MVLGLALAATTSYADTKSPVGTSVGKLAHKAHSTAGSGATKAKAKVAVRASVPRIKIRTKAAAAPVKRVAKRVTPVGTHRAAKVVRTAPRKVTPVRTHRAHKVVRAVAKRAPRLTTVRPRISTVQRKTANTRTVRAARKVIAPTARPAQHVTKPTKIHNSPNKIIKTAVKKPTVMAAQTTPIEVRAGGTVQGQPSVELALTVPDEGVHLSVEASVSQVEVSVPLLDLPAVTLPPVELPQLNVPRTDPPLVTLPWMDPPTVPGSGVDLAPLIPPGNPAVTEPVSQVDLRLASLGDSESAQAGTTRAPHRVVTELTGHPIASMLSVQAWAMRLIGPLDDVGQRVSAMKVPTPVGPATALVFAATIGAAAIGTAGSGSAGVGGSAVVSAGLSLLALTGSRRLSGRLRESAFRRPRLPGFAPD